MFKDQILWCGTRPVASPVVEEIFSGKGSGIQTFLQTRIRQSFIGQIDKSSLLLQIKFPSPEKAWRLFLLFYIVE